MNIRNRLAWRAKLLRNPENISFNPWLRDRGSLTTHLQARGQFVVRVLRQKLAMPTIDEAIALGIKRDQLAWVREVVLLCNGDPLVYAHSVLPCRPRGPMTRWLACLGNRSLGALLFAHPGFARGVIHGKRLDHRHALFYPALKAMCLAASPPPYLWARRSRFTFGAQSALVTEVFAPALICAGDYPINNQQLAAAQNYTEIDRLRVPKPL